LNSSIPARDAERRDGAEPEEDDPGGVDDVSKVYRLYLEIGAKDGWCMVHCPELPGVGFKAPSREIAVSLSPLRLEAELEWARRVGLEVEPAGNPPVEVVGAVTVDVPVAAGETEAISGPEMVPLDDEYLSFIRRHLEASRKTLLDLVKRLPDAAFGWRPGKGKRTIGEILGHIASAEAYYIVRLEPPEAVTKALWEQYAQPRLPILERLAEVRRLCLERLDELSDEDRQRTTRHEPHSETWTARKVLRRMAWHERYHTRQIETYLTT